jgi:hypothetical protein
MHPQSPAAWAEMWWDRPVRAAASDRIGRCFVKDKIYGDVDDIQFFFKFNGQVAGSIGDNSDSQKAPPTK